MAEIFNIYCDESCTLEHDHIPVMVLGAVWCPVDKRFDIAQRLRDIKKKHHLSQTFELKWTKVSLTKIEYYREVLDYFFDDDDLHFRALIVPDKTKLRHEAFGQDHDTFYYKIYFDLLKVIISPKAEYRIYLDIKDTRSADKVAKLHNVLCTANYDYNRNIISRVQSVCSSEVEQIQLADFLIGIIQYANRNLRTSQAKLSLVERMRDRSKYTLTGTTLLREEKVNLFCWRAQESNQ